jgi:AcrR family transcriptional regulator
MSAATLRDQHAELTRDLIFQALTRLVLDEGVHDLSIQQVADVAGVSHRTVYRYFSSREELLEGLAEWLDSRMPRGLDLYGPDEIADAIRDTHAVFAQQADRVKALAVLAAGARIRLRQRKRHTRTVQRVITAFTGRLEKEDARAVAILIRALAGSHMWSHLTDEYGMDDQQVTRVVVWAVTTLVEALKAGKGPGIDEESKSKKRSVKEKNRS